MAGRRRAEAVHPARVPAIRVEAAAPGPTQGATGGRRAPTGRGARSEIQVEVGPRGEAGRGRAPAPTAGLVSRGSRLVILSSHFQASPVAATAAISRVGCPALQVSNVVRFAAMKGRPSWCSFGTRGYRRSSAGAARWLGESAHPCMSHFPGWPKGIAYSWVPRYRRSMRASLRWRLRPRTITSHLCAFGRRYAPNSRP